MSGLSHVPLEPVAQTHQKVVVLAIMLSISCSARIRKLVNQIFANFCKHYQLTNHAGEPYYTKKNGVEYDKHINEKSC